jgi:hypothetical protein
MRSRLAWLVAGFGVAAAASARFFRRRGSAPDERADELRQRIAESRAVVDERDAFEEAETRVDEAPDPEARRREVHERGRAAIDRMQEGTHPGKSTS